MYEIPRLNLWVCITSNRQRPSLRALMEAGRLLRMLRDRRDDSVCGGA